MHKTLHFQIFFIPKWKQYKDSNNNYPFWLFDMIFQHQYYNVQKILGGVGFGGLFFCLFRHLFV